MQHSHCRLTGLCLLATALLASCSKRTGLDEAVDSEGRLVAHYVGAIEFDGVRDTIDKLLELS